MAAGSNQKRISAYATPLARVDVDVGGGWCEYVCAMFMCCKMDVYFVLFFVRASPLRTLKALFYCSGFFVVLFFFGALKIRSLSCIMCKMNRRLCTFLRN